MASTSLAAFLMVMLAGLAGLAGCPATPPPHLDAGPRDDDDFDDHSVPALDSVDDFEALAGPAASSTELKFVITRFLQPGERLRFIASDEYTLHDQWYWFRLMNGRAVDGVDVSPVDVGRSFAHVDDIVQWARLQTALPLDLTFVDGGRLYSPHFYDLALFDTPKTLGIGTVLHFADVPGRPETWAIELEYQHVLSRDELVDMLAAVEAALPPEIGDSLKILVRAPQHEDLYRQLLAAGDPLAQRFIHYGDVTAPVPTQVIVPGLTAGRIQVVEDGALPAFARSTEILVSAGDVDALPPCAALLSTAPGFLLDDVGLRALRRGVPDVVAEGALDDPGIDQLARVRAPGILHAAADGTVSLVAMTEQDYAQYRAAAAVPRAVVPQVDPASVAYAFSFGAGGVDVVDEETWRARVGEAALGRAALVRARVAPASDALAISVRAYREHMAPLVPLVSAVLVDSSFAGSADVRFLALEGVDAWSARHPELPDFPQQLLAQRPDGDPLKTAIKGGGITGLIRAAPVDEGALDAITSALDQRFGAASTLSLQASPVVDVAAPVASTASPAAPDTIGRALVDAWASAWSAGTIEELRFANADPLANAVGAVVTPVPAAPPRDDAAHGVMRVTLAPAGALVEVEAQPGDAAIGLGPEIDRLGADGGVTRVRSSSLRAPARPVLSDDELAHLAALGRHAATAWLTARNAALPLGQRRAELTVDLTFARTASGLVVDGARVSEPSTARVPAAVRQMPIPRDVLARAARVEQRTCDAGDVAATFTEVFTDEDALPDAGFSRAPFTSFVVVSFAHDVPALGAAAGQRRSAIHTAFSVAHPGMDAGGPWDVDVTVDADQVAGTGLSRVAFDGTTLTVARDQSVSAPATCSTAVLSSSPADFLRTLLAR